ncbi:hypothetical protein QBZ16_004368 [Prototheca wickerhamii]|uniref:Structural maintenance of chromosomes protein 5 n=1 Tax=Prototheca wickerhamii TaxID=3111 RepID=A0AAD9ML50_PROWI|nr:hypothetical protein QBZ16_004368 [Prototheca wickerhamii]
MLLGRAEDVSSFVRQGASSGWVAVTLHGRNGRDVTIKRVMRATANSSDWFINGRDARQREVLEAVEGLNIRLDNLCQFLPQDKVVEFARLDPPALLRATQASIGSGELARDHGLLIDGRKDRERLEKSMSALQERMETLRQQNARIEPAVRVMRRRQVVQEEVRLAGSKAAWLERRAAESRRRAAESRHAELERAVAELRQKALQHDSAAKRLKTARQNAEAARGRASGKVSEQARRLQSAGWVQGRAPALDELLADAHGLERGLAGLAAEEEARQRSIAELASKVASLQQARGQEGHEAEVRRLKLESQQAQSRVRALQATSRGLTGQLSERERQVQLVQRATADARARASALAMESTFERQLSALESTTPGITRVTRWLADNPGLFRAPVHGPVGALIEVADRDRAAALEKHLPRRLQNVFVVSTREDQDLLQQELQRRFGYGIIETLDQSFSAPQIVKQYLDDETHITKSLFGALEAQENVDAILNSGVDVSTIYLPGMSYRLYKSIYNSRAKSCSIQQVAAPALLHPKPAHLEAQRVQLEKELARLADQESDLHQACNALTSQLQLAVADTQAAEQDAQAAKQRLQAQLAMSSLATYELSKKQGELEALRQAPSLEARQRGLQSQIGVKLRLAQEQAAMLANAQTALGSARRELALAELECRVIDQCIRGLSTSNTRSNTQLEQARTDLAGAQMVVNQRQSELNAREAALRELAQDGDEAEYERFPEGLVELEDFISAKEIELEGLAITVPGAVEQYEARLAAIEGQEAERAELGAELERLNGAIATARERWLPQLQRIVQRVNASFQRNFVQVGCAGEVVLHEAENEDFERYAIEIRVKFRESQELQTLDAHRQSGGERSVATILYLIALQGVTVAPFRVVDEINQGMDPFNERKVYSLLVDAASRPGTPQCFLLTPKLLPNLPFNESVTILQIMNGAHISTVAGCFSTATLLGSQRLSALVGPGAAA